jgi:hypothetical protein
MSLGVRVFIATVFTAIGLSFLATTAVLVWEFWDTDWLGIASFYSHLFLFFPTFGIVTLLAFYTPACVFTDMYMRHIPWGIPRFGFGLVVLVGLSVFASQAMTGAGERSIFEVRPGLLVADRGEPPNCAGTGACDRLPVLRAVENVRRVSQTRIGLADLARNCRPDTLKDQITSTTPAKRYCFVSTPLPEDISSVAEAQRTTDQQCCRAQGRFTAAVRELHDSSGGRSLTALAHSALLPFKIFFALVLFVISIMLAVRRQAMEVHYAGYTRAIERGVLVGAVAMVIFPVMSHAFLQSAALLYYGGGPTGGYRATAPAFSFALGAWGLLLLFFFYGRQNERVQNLARIGGMIGSAVAVVKYDQIIDVCVRLFGTGAGLLNVALLCAAAFAAMALIMTWKSYERRARRAARASQVDDAESETEDARLRDEPA